MTVSSDQMELSWFALQVRSRYESVVSTLLAQKGYEEFLPVRREKRRWCDRVKEIWFPLFPGYLFCRFDPNRRQGIVMTPHVVGVVGVGRTPTPVAEDEVNGIREIVQSGMTVEECGYVGTGERVRIMDGPLRGLEGYVVTTKKQHRLVVSVTLLQRSVAVEVDAESLFLLPEEKEPKLRVAARGVCAGWAC